MHRFPSLAVWPLFEINPEHRFRHFFAGASSFAGTGKMVEHRACVDLDADAMKVPETVGKSIRILEAPAVSPVCFPHYGFSRTPLLVWRPRMC